MDHCDNFVKILHPNFQTIVKVFGHVQLKILIQIEQRFLNFFIRGTLFYVHFNHGTPTFFLDF